MHLLDIYYVSFKLQLEIDHMKRLMEAEREKEMNILENKKRNFEVINSFESVVFRQKKYLFPIKSLR